MRTGSWLAALAFGVVLVVSPREGAGQTAAPDQQAAAGFSPEQLEQLVAPIALYPDSLLTQTLMASTYPLEVVQAARWLKKNPSLKGSSLDEPLKGQDWDPSVKSICSFPEVLDMMNDNLDWMQDLGDAFLGQQVALLDAVQRMRAKAYESGSLKNTEQQKVTQTSEKIVIIEPASPEVIYVPTYAPTVVYAGWYYPSWYYPAFYAPPPPGYGFLSFTAGVVWGAAMWGHCNWGHGHGHVDININRYNSFNRSTSVRVEHYAARAGGGDRAQWQHNAEHRKGVNYRNTAVAEKYGGPGASRNVTRDQARGWSESRPSTPPGGGGREPGSRPSGGMDRPSTLPSGGGREPGSRPSGVGERPATLPGGGADRPAAGSADRRPAGGASAGSRDVPKASGGGAQRPAASDRSYSQPGGSRNGAYSGSRSPGADAKASSRGSSSRGSSSYGGSKSGGSRPSGGGGSRPSGGGNRGGGRR